MGVLGRYGDVLKVDFQLHPIERRVRQPMDSVTDEMALLSLTIERLLDCDMVSETAGEILQQLVSETRIAFKGGETTSVRECTAHLLNTLQELLDEDGLAVIDDRLLAALTLRSADSRTGDAL